MPERGFVLPVFRFLSKISEIQKGTSLTAEYTLKEGEEFLEDHFKGFPVMPGVLLLESLKQAGWLLLAVSCDFKEPIFRLAAAENLRFGQFVRPGSRCKVTVNFLRHEPPFYVLNGRVDLERGTPPPVSQSEGLRNPPGVDSSAVRRRSETGGGGKALSADLKLVPVECVNGERAALEKNVRRLFEELTVAG